jgi:hypothetical protein
MIRPPLHRLRPIALKDKASWAPIPGPTTQPSDDWDSILGDRAGALYCPGSHWPKGHCAGATRDGGEGGIRTPDRLAPMPHFECGAFNHSATSPRMPNQGQGVRGRGRVLGEDARPDKARPRQFAQASGTWRRGGVGPPYATKIGGPVPSLEMLPRQARPAGRAETAKIKVAAAQRAATRCCF